MQPTTLSSSDYQVARKKVLSGEMEVWIAPGQVIPFGVVEFATLNNGVLTADDYNVLATIHPTGTNRLGAVVKEYFECTAAATVSFSAKDAGGDSMTGSAVIKPPTWAPQSFLFSEGIAFDITPDVAYTGKLWKSDFAYTGRSGGDISATSAFRILSFPDAADFKQMTCNTAIDYKVPIRPAVAIPCGMEAAGGGVKPGRAEQPTFSIKTKYSAYCDGIAKYAGKYCTILVRTKKEGRVIVEDTYLGNARFTSSPSFGDGNDEGTVTVEGLFEYFANFPAM